TTSKAVAVPTSCPFCEGRKTCPCIGFARSFPIQSTEFDMTKNSSIDLNFLSVDSGRKFHWVCKRCEETYICSVQRRTLEQCDCPNCPPDMEHINRINNYSSIENFTIEQERALNYLCRGLYIRCVSSTHYRQQVGREMPEPEIDANFIS